MDVTSAASKLRDQMIVMDVAQKQKEILDEQIATLSQQSLISSLDGNIGRCLQLSIRLSVNKGVQQIFKQISEKKWNQVQTTARSILSELQDTEQTTHVTSPQQGVSTSTDKTVTTWSKSFCDFYRDN